MRRQSIRRLSVVILLVGILMPLAGCQTMEGLGRDIQSAGRVLENTADRDN